MHIKEENMRNFKRGVAFAMAAVMTVSMTGVISADANEESSTISSWKEEAVITPTEGKLVGAGYINVKVNTSVTDAESYNIVLYLRYQAIRRSIYGIDSSGDLPPLRREVFRNAPPLPQVQHSQSPEQPPRSRHNAQRRQRYGRK